MQAISTYPVKRLATHLLGAFGVLALLAASSASQAQPSSDAPPAAAHLLPPPGTLAPVPPRGGALPEPIADAGPAVTLQATVSRFLTNPDGEVDGFLTRDGAIVHVGPRAGTRLAAAIRPGDTVQVTGTRDAVGNLVAQRVADARSGRQLAEAPPPGAPPTPGDLRGAGLSPLSAQGEVAHVTTAPRGEPDGVILTDGTSIKLTPPVAQQFPQLLRVGASVAAQGYGTRNEYGTALQATAFGPPGKLSRLYDSPPPAP
ncbi:hypothetical protein [Burkholderia gladioli]|uniref:hypothetical protein n=1 Tax=Burkholderia gladioli TaxID=28095 RepID=UPI00164222B9|nr:hypothetical protein [Burkholderia gladioli]